MKYNEIKNLNWVSLDSCDEIVGITVFKWTGDEPVSKNDMENLLENIICWSANRLGISHFLMKKLFMKQNKEFYLKYNELFRKQSGRIDMKNPELKELEKMILVPYKGEQKQRNKKSGIKKFMNDMESLNSEQIERIEQELYSVLTYLNI